MSNKYPIPNNWSLRQVYLAWLIATDPQEFLQEHELGVLQVTAFKEYPYDTWERFQQLRGLA